MKIISLCLTLFLVLVAKVNAADIFLDTFFDLDNVSTLPTIFIRGEIVRGDYEKLINVVKKHGSIPSTIFVDSVGGDVIEAMKIGRFARKALLTTGEPTAKRKCQNGCVCYSACMFIYLACVNRTFVSLFGEKVSYAIHRPYFDRSYFSGLSMKKAELKYKELENSVKTYLEEMNVPQSIIERMFSIPSDRMEVLTGYQIIEIMKTSPPAYEEWLLAKCGNLTPDEGRDSLKIAIKEKHNFSPGYVKYLQDKMEKLVKCRVKAREEVRKEVFRSLK